MAWVSTLTDLEAQLKEVLHPVAKAKPEPKPEPKPESKMVIFTNTIENVETPTPDLDKRKIHKEVILKKKALLESQGISPSKLLTEEALRKWIADGKSYWTIAEEIGVLDAEISALAKKIGVQSKVSKLAFMKKKAASS